MIGYAKNWHKWKDISHVGVQELDFNEGVSSYLRLVSFNKSEVNRLTQSTGTVYFSDIPKVWIKKTKE